MIERNQSCTPARAASSGIAVSLAFVLAAGGASAQTCSTTRISVDSSGAESDSASGTTALSADGRYVAFQSGAANLVANDTNGTSDVFVHDRLTGITERISIASNGAEGDGPSSYPSMSADGRYLVFTSWASTLVPSDTNQANDVFMNDRVLGTTVRLSVDASGNEGNSYSYLGAISPDGRFVALLSFASNLVAGDTNDQRDVFVHDVVADTTRRVSLSSSGAEGNESSGGSSGGAFVSSGGRFVVFASSASNLVAGDTNGFEDVFVRDLWLGITARLSNGAGGVQADDDVNVTSLSGDGRYAAVASAATNLVPNDTNGSSDAFVVELASGQVERVSVGANGAEGTGHAWVPALSGDARFAAFLSTAPDLVQTDLNGKRDVFVRDRLAGTTIRVSVSDALVATTEDCSALAIDANGEVVAFTTASPVIVQNDLNDLADVFVRECRVSDGFCFGTASACPCGNRGAWNSGCASSWTAGAILSTQGTAFVSADSLTLLVNGLPPSVTVLFLEGSAQLGGGFGVVLGDGLRCIGGQTRRLAPRTSSAGTAHYGAGLDPLLSVQGQVPNGGDTRYYQAWYRNSAPYCTSSTFNFSNGVTVLWTP